MKASFAPYFITLAVLINSTAFSLPALQPKTKILVVGGLGIGQDPSLYKHPIEKTGGFRYTLNHSPDLVDFDVDITAADARAHKKLSSFFKKKQFDIVHLEYAEHAVDDSQTYANVIALLKPGGYLVIDGLDTDFYKFMGGKLEPRGSISFADFAKGNNSLFKSPLLGESKGLKYKDNFESMARFLLLEGFENITVMHGKHPINGREREVWLEAQLVGDEHASLIEFYLRKEPTKSLDDIKKLFDDDAISDAIVAKLVAHYRNLFGL